MIVLIIVSEIITFIIGLSFLVMGLRKSNKQKDISYLVVGTVVGLSLISSALTVLGGL